MVINDDIITNILVVGSRMPFKNNTCSVCGQKKKQKMGNKFICLNCGKENLIRSYRRKKENGTRRTKGKTRS